MAGRAEEHAEPFLGVSNHLAMELRENRPESNVCLPKYKQI